MIHQLAVRVRLRLSQPINTSAVIIMALYTMLWGFWVGNPYWHVFHTAPVYSTLLSIMPEVYWGLIAFVCGWFMLQGVITQGFNALSRGAFIGSVHWALISVCYFIGDWRNTAGITAAMVCVYCAYVYLNLRMNKKDFPFLSAKVSPVD